MDESKIKPSEDDNALVNRLKQAEQQLDDCRQENMHFLYIAAHDLHAPVRKLTTFIERLKVRGTEFTEEERQLLFIKIEKNTCANELCG
jgi:light-regulated signal transduction histidine kinase (bacteriophytochrome)